MVTLIWLASLIAAGLIYLALQIARSPYSAWENCLYTPTYLMGRLLWRVEFSNSAPAALQSGALLVANHRSSVDPFFVQLAARRRVHWMVAKEYCNHLIFGSILKLLQVIPTNRSGMDTAATKSAIRLIKEGRLVGMFPEGRLNHSAAPLLPLRAGAAVVAKRGGVPIVPLLIEGSPYDRTVWSPIFMPARVRITFGTVLNTESTHMGDDPQADESHRSSPLSKADERIAAEELILQWGQQICDLKGTPDATVCLASSRRRGTSS